MSDDVSDRILTSYIESTAALQGLTIASEWRSGILAHLEAITTAAALVIDFPLDDDIEAAPIFQP